MWVERHRKFPYLSGSSFLLEVYPKKHMKAKFHVTKHIHIFSSKSLTFPFPSLLKVAHCLCVSTTSCFKHHANNRCISSSPKLQLCACINQCLTHEAWFSISTPSFLHHEQAALLHGDNEQLSYFDFSVRCHLIRASLGHFSVPESTASYLWHARDINTIKMSCHNVLSIPYPVIKYINSIDMSKDIDHFM